MDFTVYFVRHGETDWNFEGRLQGRVDTDINETGQGQADANGRKLAGLIGDAGKFSFVASPMRRTRETMERLRRAMGLPAEGYETDERLVEVHFGNWQGHTFAELERMDPGCFARRASDKWNFLPPGGDAETYAMLAERVRPFFESLSGDTVCVTHGGIIRSVFRLTGTLDEAGCATLRVPQDKVLRYAGGRLDWV